MSFKLSELLNPAPPTETKKNEQSHSPPSLPPSLSSSSSRITRSPEPYSAPQHPSAYASYNSHQHASTPTTAALTSSYETPSVLTALATSASSYSPHYSTTLPPLASSAAARRTSYSALSQFTDPAAPVLSHTYPSPTHNTLEQYRSSRSPDAARRQSLSTLFDLDTSSAATVATTGPTLAPLHRHTGARGGASPTSATPRTQGSAGSSSETKSPPTVLNVNASGHLALASPASSLPHAPEGDRGSLLRHHSLPYPPAQLSASSSSSTAAKMDETGEGATTVIQQPATTQIREPSAAAPEAKMTPQAPEPAERQPLGGSPDAKIKDEPTGTPMEGTPVKDMLRRESIQGEGPIDDDTMKAIEAAKNDFSLRAARQKAQPSIEEPIPTIAGDVSAAEESKGKKRPAPKVKKGQATVKKPPSKKRRVDDNASSTTATRRSLSPGRASKIRPSGGPGKKSKSNTPALGSSPAPGSVVSASDQHSYASDASSDDNANDVFCICRKGDNHTWMIACDGGCEDWFHGKCVDILEADGELIDKYICPNCVKTSGGKVTTWLPGCRNRGCRKPARIRRGNMSKYCSEKCGREFMAGELARSESARRKANGTDTNASNRPKRKGITMAEINGETGDNSDDDLGPRGGALKASELKALVTSSNGDVAAFRSLGAVGVLSPPATASPTAERFPTDPTAEATAATNTAADLTPTEQARTDAIAKEKDDLRRRRTLLKDREKFGQLVRENVAKYAEREKLKPKDVCGYDNRLTWSEDEFALWRDSDEGVAALASGTLPLPDLKGDAAKIEVNGSAEDDKMDVDGDAGAAGAAAPKRAPSMCTKKRCERHRQWQKQALADVRFEESQMADRMRSLEAEEREIREAALLRGRMEASGLRGEGVVEVVGAE